MYLVGINPDITKQDTLNVLEGIKHSAERSYFFPLLAYLKV